MISNTTIKVSVDDLQLGMFVSDLDRPWLETPYPIQGILIQCLPKDIQHKRNMSLTPDARMAAIVDCYEELIEGDPGRRA
ncbi:MAG: DUF3391 domain-containing protein [Proteobacteria bacterium]|nr:DUF3391 domain-containing protein [Pseudomonadota bacterium]